MATRTRTKEVASISFTKDNLERLDECADRLQRSRSSLVNEMIEFYYASNQKDGRRQSAKPKAKAPRKTSK